MVINIFLLNSIPKVSWTIRDCHQLCTKSSKQEPLRIISDSNKKQNSEEETIMVLVIQALNLSYHRD